MKKAKIILTSVAVLAVIGGAFAFKASRSLVRYYTPNLEGACVVPLDIRYTTNPLDASGPNTTFYTSITTISGAPCTTKTLYQFQ